MVGKSTIQSVICGIFILLGPCLFGQEEDRFPEGGKESEVRFIPADGNGPVDQDRMVPPFWWVGMVDPNLELMLHSRGIGDMELRIDYPGVELLAIDRPQNPNYLFVHLHIGPGTPAGQLELELKRGEERKRFVCELRNRTLHSDWIQGLGPEDLVYLIMPDRFANGDPRNDDLPGMNQTGINRDNVYFRHGGDLQGVLDRLDYLQELGITALWLNPVFENDQAYESYHGYAPTDHYRVDPRLGDNELYRQLVQACHQRGIKVVMDVIHNHVGDQHWFIRDLPSEDWIHQWPEYTKTSYRAPTLMDPYASEYDRAIMSDGWFDRHMPDLNQQNPHVARYLIQNHLWWLEYSGQDAYRVDTYAYPDPDFASRWGQALTDQYPRVGLFAETWVHGSTIQAHFAQDNDFREGYNSHMPAVTDYQVQYGIMDALTKKQGWTDGVSKLYYALAKDFLYEDPYRNVIFLDNHDVSRFYCVDGVDSSWNKYRSGIALLLTQRGVHMMYNRTDIMQSGKEGVGGAFGEGGRVDFPGGWSDDATDKFAASGRTPAEERAYQYVKTLANYRKNTPALQGGRMTQFVPVDDIYVYFRYDEQTTVMVVLNTSDAPQVVDTQRYRERMLGFGQAKEVTSGELLDRIDRISIGAHSALVLELQP